MNRARIARIAVVAALAGGVLLYARAQPVPQPLAFAAPRDLRLLRLNVELVNSSGEVESGFVLSPETARLRVEKEVWVAPGHYELRIQAEATPCLLEEVRCAEPNVRWDEAHSVELSGEPLTVRLTHIPEPPYSVSLGF